MLDKKTEALLTYVNDNIGTTFTVVSKAEILAAVPEKLNMSSDDFHSAINFLKDKELITVKYQDKDEICLAGTLRAQAYFEHKKVGVEKVDLSMKQYGTVFALAFFGAFLGALLAFVIFKLF